MVKRLALAPRVPPARRQSNMNVLAAAARSGGASFVVGIIFVLILLAPAARILRRTGYSPWFCLLLLIPLVNIIMVFVFAFSTWPVDRAPRGYGQVGPPGQVGYPEPPWPGQAPQGYVPGGPQFSSPGWPPPPGAPVPPPPVTPVPPPPPVGSPPPWPGGTTQQSQAGSSWQGPGGFPSQGGSAQPVPPPPPPYPPPWPGTEPPKQP